MSSLLIRPIKRAAVGIGELSILVLGLILSIFLTAYLVPPREGDEAGLAALVFFAGLSIAILVFVVIRRKTRRWKIEYDAIGWALTRTERKLHPTRARNKRIAVRIIIWAPSVIAALVLLFFPV